VDDEICRKKREWMDHSLIFVLIAFHRLF
ncbi:MAG: hypothetical protein K0S25_2053, partial [Bacillus sp. (in: firmicutes)]|nr:hypothetical protein [Bacillus sp. (in: firmicutes)]